MGDERNAPAQGTPDWHGAQAAYFEGLREKLGFQGAEAWKDKTWQEHTLKVLYHRLCQSPEGYLPTALNGYVDALANGGTLLFPWADAILRAGEDVGNAELRQWGGELGRPRENVYRGWMERMCTTLLDSGHLKSSSQAVLLAWRGSQLRARGEFRDAEADDALAQEMGANSPDVLTHLSQERRLSGQFEEALSLANQAVALGPDLPLAYWHRALLLARMGLYEEAWADAKRCVVLGAPERNPCRATIFMAMGRYEEARAELDAVLAGNPDWIWPLFIRGEAKLCLRSFPEAVADFSQAIELNPGRHESAEFGRGMAYFAMGEREQAGKDWSSALQTREGRWREAPSALGRGQLLLTLAALGKGPESERICKELLESSPSPYLVGMLVRELDVTISLLPDRATEAIVRQMLMDHLNEIAFDPYDPPKPAPANSSQ